MAKKLYNMIYEPDASGFVRQSVIAKTATKAKNKMWRWLSENTKIDADIADIKIESTQFIDKDLQ